jgi:hypothetical protein
MSTPLEELGRPLFFEVKNGNGFDAPTPHLDQPHQTRVRSVGGMQKEALVTAASPARPGDW